MAVTHLRQKRRWVRRIERQDELPSGAGDGDIGKAPLLLEGPPGLFGIDQRAAVGDPIGFKAHEHHRLPLPSLRGVDGGQLDRGRWIAKGRDPRPCRVVGGDEVVESCEAGRPPEQCIERGVILVAEMIRCRVVA